jgi:predicted nucleic acid-binding protein
MTSGVGMTHEAVLLDTSFFLRFLKDTDPLFHNADGYFRYFIQQGIRMMISTISIAEYCVRGDVTELPLRNIQIVPFNFDHAKRTGEFARIAFEAKRIGRLDLASRNVIPNDAKLFAQADCEHAVLYYLSSDSESLKIYNLLRERSEPKFRFIDLNTPYHETFGVLDL